MSASLRFDDRVALVTGAGQGLGRAYALALAARGAAVIVNDLDLEACSVVVGEIRALGGRGIEHHGSVASYAAAREMVSQALQKFGRLDIVVNNAGIIRDRSFHKMSIDELDLVIDVHLRGTAYVCHAAWPHLREQKYGRLVLVSSSSALWGNFGQANYDAAKLGIVGLMQALKLEGAEYGIRVNTVAPFAMTRMGAEFFPEELRSRLGTQPIEALVTYLCSEACQASGAIFEAGADRIRVARIVASEGLSFQPGFTAEDVRLCAERLLAERGQKEFTSLRSAFDSLLQHGSLNS